MLKSYYQLAKPGIIYGNIITTIGGFLLAAKWHIDIRLFLATMLGMSLIIGSACVYNNVLDRNIDKKMARTRKRALVRGSIPMRSALLYATILGVIGFVLLIAYVNSLVVVIAAIGFVDYVALYDYSKRHFVSGTLVGSISGAAPIVAGYCAVTDRFDMGAFILFIILACWQMAHFYSIAIYRLDDYKAADIPVLPAKRGVHRAKIEILLYIVAFLIANIALRLRGYVGYIYVIVMTGLGLTWLTLGLQTFKTSDDKRWGKRMFLRSLIVILGVAAMLSVGSILP